MTGTILSGLHKTVTYHLDGTTSVKYYDPNSSPPVEIDPKFYLRKIRYPEGLKIDPYSPRWALAWPGRVDQMPHTQHYHRWETAHADMLEEISRLLVD